MFQTIENWDIVVESDFPTTSWPGETTTPWPEPTQSSRNSKQFIKEHIPYTRNGRGEFQINIPDNWSIDTPIKLVVSKV